MFKVLEKQRFSLDCWLLFVQMYYTLQMLKKQQMLDKK